MDSLYANGVVVVLHQSQVRCLHVHRTLIFWPYRNRFETAVFKVGHAFRAWHRVLVVMILIGAMWPERGTVDPDFLVCETENICVDVPQADLREVALVSLLTRRSVSFPKVMSSFQWLNEGTTYSRTRRRVSSLNRHGPRRIGPPSLMRKSVDMVMMLVDCLRDLFAYCEPKVEGGRCKPDNTTPGPQPAHDGRRSLQLSFR